MQPSVDAIVLMSDSMVLGPQPDHHVFCPRWSESVAMARTSETDAFRYRAVNDVEINSESAEISGVLAAGAQLTGADFALCLEAL